MDLLPLRSLVRPGPTEFFGSGLPPQRSLPHTCSDRGHWLRPGPGCLLRPALLEVAGLGLLLWVSWCQHAPTMVADLFLVLWSFLAWACSCGVSVLGLLPQVSLSWVCSCRGYWPVWFHRGPDPGCSMAEESVYS